MACRSRIANKNNFVQWYQLTDVTLAQLQSSGVEGLPLCAEELRVCGLGITVSVNNATSQVTVKPTFQKISFPVEFRIETSAGVTVVDWTTATSMTQTLTVGNYVAKVRNVADTTCQAESSFQMQMVCGIGLDVYINRSEVLIQHTYSGASFPTEYAVFHVNDTTTPLVGYEWTVRTRWTFNTLQDGTYIARVRRQGSTVCLKEKRFTLKNEYLQLINFAEQHLALIHREVWTNDITLRNTGTLDKEVLIEVISAIEPFNIYIRKGLEQYAYKGRETWIIPAGTDVKFSLTFWNNSGIEQQSIIRLQDKDTSSQGIKVIKGSSSYFELKPSITIRTTAS